MARFEALKDLAATKGYSRGWLSTCAFVADYFARSYVLVVLARIAPPGLTTAQECRGAGAC